MGYDENHVAADGNCGFTTLGITRGQLVNALLPLRKDVENRIFLSDEIYSAFMQSEFTIDDKGLALRDQDIAKQTDIDTLFRKIRNDMPEAMTHLSIDDTIKWLLTNGRADEAV